MKKVLLLKSTSLLVILFAAVTLFFTSANTEKEANNQAIAELSAKVAHLNKALTTLSADKTTVGSVGESPYIGEITMFAGNYAPRNWAFCNGQLLPISQHNALFSLLGTNYGGDGRTTFALPDLRGRVPVHSGDGNAGPGLERIQLGQRGGSEEIHYEGSVKVKRDETGDVSVIGRIQQSNRQPYLGVNYIIALEGTWPPRS